MECSLLRNTAVSLAKTTKKTTKNCVTKLIPCRIPSVERSKWDWILFHRHFIIVTSYITVNKNLPQCLLNRQPDAAKTGCPPTPHGWKGQCREIFCFWFFSICHRCQRHRWCTLSYEYLREFSKNWKWPYGYNQGLGGKLIHVENLK